MDKKKLLYEGEIKKNYIDNMKIAQRPVKTEIRFVIDDFTIEKRIYSPIDAEAKEQALFEYVMKRFKNSNDGDN